MLFPPNDNRTVGYSMSTFASETKPQGGNTSFLDVEFPAAKLRKLQDGHLDFNLNDTNAYNSTSKDSGASAPRTLHGVALEQQVCLKGEHEWPLA